jgi:hypothetical protein
VQGVSRVDKAARVNFGNKEGSAIIELENGGRPARARALQWAERQTRGDKYHDWECRFN